MTEKLHTNSSANAGRLDLLELWWDTQRKNLVRYDPNILILHHLEGGKCDSNFAWGTVFYSKAREEYKSRASVYPEIRATTFDLTLMNQLVLAATGQLVIAANPNSLIPGHLIVYPQEKRADLNFEDISDMCSLAAKYTDLTFIHNMEHAAASVLDWGHFQAYPWSFPLVRETGVTIYETNDFNLTRLPEDYPSFVLMVETEKNELMAAWLFGMLRSLAAGCEASRGKRIPCNIIWYGTRSWLIPRSLSQTTFAATYIGALEMGGLFCLPSADNLRQYLPETLKLEVHKASLANDPSLLQWCERTALSLGRRIS